MADLERLITDNFKINSPAFSPLSPRDLNRQPQQSNACDTPKSALKIFTQGKENRLFHSPSRAGKENSVNIFQVKNGGLGLREHPCIFGKPSFSSFPSSPLRPLALKENTMNMYVSPARRSSIENASSPLVRSTGKRGATDNGRTPSKFSVVRNSLSSSPYSVPQPRQRPEPLLDFASQDSGFENSSSFDSGTSKLLNPTYHKMTLDEDISESARHFDGMATDQSVTDVTSTRLEKKLTYSDYEFDTLHDLEEEFDTDLPSENSLSKYEIISTDSPNITSGHVGRIFARNFEFGSPIGDSETSENFGEVQPQRIPRRMPARSETTRMLNFDIDTSANFQFTPPATMPPKRSTSISETLSLHKVRSPVDSEENSFDFSSKRNRIAACLSFDEDSPIASKSTLRSELHMKDDSAAPPGARRSRLFDSISTGSIESGTCMSEMEDCMLFEMENNDEVDDIPSSMGALISCEIKHNAETSVLHGASGMLDVTPDRTLKRPLLRRSISLNPELEACQAMQRVRVTLFKSPSRGFKRPEPPIEVRPSCSKRRKSSMQEEMIRPRPGLLRAMSDNAATIKMALSRSSTEPDLIGDFSVPYALPLMESQHQDLKAIDSDTLANLLRGQYEDKVDSFQVVDCRYPYEFEGGHIAGAKNLYTEQMIQQELMDPAVKDGRRLLVFHCEFSTERGPRLCRFLRTVDRALHRDSYPSLLHPELYILRGGYRLFHERHASLCLPEGAYVAMLDPSHTRSMREYRAQAERARKFL